MKKWDYEENARDRSIQNSGIHLIHEYPHTPIMRYNRLPTDIPVGINRELPIDLWISILIDEYKSLKEEILVLKNRVYELETINAQKYSREKYTPLIQWVNKENTKKLSQSSDIPIGDPRREALELFDELDGILSDHYNKNIDPARYIYSRD